MAKKRTVVLGLLGTTVDAGLGTKRWERWRPTVSIGEQPDMVVDRLELLHDDGHDLVLGQVVADFAAVSPDTKVRTHPVKWRNAWDFESVYAALHDFALEYPFDVEREDYLVHITTGSHVAQICLFLLTESRHLPARLLQTSPGRSKSREGSVQIIDLDLSRYDRLAQRFHETRTQGLSFLKAGIETKNARFNRLIERIEEVAVVSPDPLLLTGPTGAGKSQLARRIYELKKSRKRIGGDFVEVNCATVRGDGAMSALFGHVKGSFTGASADRPGLLRRAHGGMLFLDEVGELGPDEQAMLLRAIETKTFLPVGSDREVSSDFQLLAGTNRDLRVRVREGLFRDDLLARIDLWTFELPGLRERLEDVAPNLDFELRRQSERLGALVSMSKDAREAYLRFATSSDAAWSGNFRDLAASVTRLATLAKGGRIDAALVAEEIDRLRSGWSGAGAGAQGPGGFARTERALGRERLLALDRFDRAQLEDVLLVCSRSASLSQAGRELFAESRKTKQSSNDADRLRKYLARFGLAFDSLERA
jgi:transcriptional regulatory protein RtcR